jgi:hypothetical protein
MTVDTEGFRRAHEEIDRHADELRDLAARVPSLTLAERAGERDRVVAYLRRRVEMHMKHDERLLYPETSIRLGDPLISASMRYDHRAIRRWIDDIAAADVADTALLQRLLYGLEALIRVHLWKEDELFLAPLRNPSWPG